MSKRILIALGGNAIKQADEKGTMEEQLRNCEVTCRHLAEIVTRMGKDDRLIITHGNGPQVGNLIVQQDLAKRVVPPQNMDIIVAMTQGQIGYMLQQSLANCLTDSGNMTPVCTVVTRVLVDKDDPELTEKFTASKPVGNFFTDEEAEKIKTEHPGYIIRKVKPKGTKAWRRCVPSPHPLAIVEGATIRRLVDAGVVVIASGGGGIPVTLNEEHGYYEGLEAVIDKDLAGEKLAEVVGADTLLIATDVDKVRLNFGKRDEKPLDKMTLAQAKTYMEEGHFLSGSMKPKIMACIRFLESGGEKAIITSIDKITAALENRAGTLIETNGDLR